MGQEYLRRITTQQDINFLSETLLLDDFENTVFKWAIGGAGTPVIGRLDTTAFNGGACAQLKPNTTTPIADDVASVAKSLPLRGYEQIELSMMLNVQNASNLKYLSISLGVGDGTYARTFTVYYIGLTYIWQYLDDTNTLTDILPAHGLAAGENSWGLFGVKWDIGNSLLTGIHSGLVKAEPISKALYKTGSASSPWNYLTIEIANRSGGTPPEVYIDNLMVRLVK